MRVRESPGAFLQKTNRFIGRQWSASIHSDAEGLALDLTHDEAQDAVPLFDRVHRYDVRV
jgi:hypothetical protein